MPTTVRDVHVENLLSGRRMLVEWTPNPTLEGVTAYEIWRSTQEYQGFEKIAEVNDPTYQFIDKIPYTFGIVFFYKVIARDASGYRSDITQSNPVSDVTFDDFEEHPFRSTTLVFNSFISNEVPAGAINSSNTLFTTASLFRFNTVEVFVNGIARVRGVSFTEGANQSTVTISPAPVTGNTVVINYIKL